jgi:hypothetical protein
MAKEKGMGKKKSVIGEMSGWSCKKCARLIIVHYLSA